MAEIKEGYYVRLVNGRIRKVTGIYGRTYFLQANDVQKFECECKRKDIVKFGEEPIDIIECGDYVNGHYVWDVFEKDGEKVLKVDCMRGYYYKNEIMEIVTKEQFEKGKYFVEG